MSYQLNDRSFTIEQVRERITASDPVPSLLIVQQQCAANLSALAAQSIETLAGLRAALKTGSKLNSLAVKTGIDAEYLNLLRREIESWFPKPHPLADFRFISPGDVSALMKAGLCNTRQAYELLRDDQAVDEFVAGTGLDAELLRCLACHCDLCRIQWTGPLFAEMLFAAKCDCAASVAQAEPDALHLALSELNKGNAYFKGSIGLRDIKRLVQAAFYTANFSC